MGRARNRGRWSTGERKEVRKEGRGGGRGGGWDMHMVDGIRVERKVEYTQIRGS